MNVSRQERRYLQRQEAKARRKLGVSPEVAGTNQATRLLWAVPMAVFVVCILAAGLVVWKARSKQESVADATIGVAGLPLIAEMVEMTDEQLTKIGIARMNLACSKGLGSRPMTDAEAADCLQNMQWMADAVRLHTANNHYKFVKNPADYENSEVYYKVAMLITVIQQDFGVHYNMAKTTMTAGGETDHFFDDPADVFVLGAFGTRHTGTCSSMPVACVAVGRELGYPLHLAVAKGHLFFRWDDGRQKMNFECTNKVNVMTDAEFRKWPFPITDEEAAQGFFLKNLTPREELAVFLSIRGAVFDYFRQMDEAINTMKMAYDLDPHPNYRRAGRAYTRRRAALVQPVASNLPDALDDGEAMYQRMMLPYYQRQGLNFVPSVMPSPSQFPTVYPPVRPVTR